MHSHLDSQEICIKKESANFYKFHSSVYSHVFIIHLEYKEGMCRSTGELLEVRGRMMGVKAVSGINN